MTIAATVRADTLQGVEPSTSPSTGFTPLDDVDLDTDDPTQRVHHHARTSHDELLPAGAIRTLCGMTLSGPRPEAADLPCCAMCGAEMEALGHRCRR